jgi:hypothetical protein
VRARKAPVVLELNEPHAPRGQQPDRAEQDAPVDTLGVHHELIDGRGWWDELACELVDGDGTERLARLRTRLEHLDAVPLDARAHVARLVDVVEKPLLFVAAT